jgi:hypothetical protein
MTLEEEGAATELCSPSPALTKVKRRSRVRALHTCTQEGISRDDPAYCDEDTLVKCIYEACQLEVNRKKTCWLPKTLIPDEELT